MIKYLLQKLRAVSRPLVCSCISALILFAGIFTHAFAAVSVDVNLNIRPTHSVPPDSVTDLYALTGNTTGQIELSWTAPPTEWGIQVLGYQIRYSKISLATLGNDVTAWWDSALGSKIEDYTYWSNPADTEAYTVKGLTPGDTYYFAIKAVDEFDNESDFDQKTQDWNQASARAMWDGIAPSTVTTLSALTGEFEGEIALSWIAPGNDGTNGVLPLGSMFRIEYSSWTGTVWSTNTSVGAYYVDISTSGVAPLSVCSHVVTGLPGGNTYYFRIWTADDVPNWSGISTGATAWAQTDVTSPAAVTDLAAEMSQQDNEILLSWTAPGDDGTKGQIVNGKWRIDFATYKKVWNIDAFEIEVTTSLQPGTSTQYTVTGLEGDTTYYFVIWTADEVPNWSGLSTAATGWTLDNVAPSAPTGLTATAGNEEAALSWTANDEPDFEHYNIYRSTNESDWFFKSSTTLTGYTDTGLVNLTTYWWRITAVDTSGNESSSSTVVSAVPADVTSPAAITDFAALTGNTTGQIELSWASPGDDGTTGNLTGVFRIDYATYTKSWVYTDYEIDIPTSALVPGALCSKVVTGLKGDTTYYFVIWTADEVPNWSGPSEVTTGRTRDNIAPSAPTGLTATAGDEEAALSWTANDEPDFEHYNIYRSTNESDWFFASSTTLTGVTDSGLVNLTTYWWRITAVDTSGNESSYSDVVSTVPADVTSPAAITDFAALTGDTTGQIELSWASPGDDGTNGNLTGQFAIFYSTMSGEAELGIYGNAQVVISTSGVAPLSARSYVVTGLQGDTSYYFVIWTADEVPNWSGLSNTATGWTLDNIAPAAPAGLTAIAGDKEVSLSWTANAETDVAGYNVYRSTNQTAWSVAGSTTLINYTDTGLVNNVTYWWRITAVDTSGNESSSSTVVSAMPYSLDETAPAAVTGLTAGSAYNALHLQWVSPGDDDWSGVLTSGSMFRIEYSSWAGTVWSTNTSVGDGYYVDISTSDLVPLSACSHVVTGLQGDTSYYFVIWTADEVLNWSGISNAATGWTLDNVAPSAPAGLTAIAGDIEVSLSWTQNAEPDVEHYRIYRSTTSDWASAGSTTAVSSATLTVFTDTGLANNSTYWYRVTAVDTSGNESAYSNDVSTVPVDMMPPASPAGMYGELSADGLTFTLRWSVVKSTDGTDCEDLAGYNVYRSTSELGPFFEVVSTTQTRCSVQKGEITLYYAVKAVDTTGNESEMSALIDDTAQMNLWIISRSSKGAVEAIVKIPAAFNKILRGACEDDDVVIKTDRKTAEENYPDGRIIRSFDFTARENISGDEVKTSFEEPLIEIKIFYQGYDVAVGEGSVKSLSASPASAITNPEKEMAILWFNGVEWVKLGGEVDTREQSVGIFTSHLGKYQLRHSLRAIVFEVPGPKPKIITPDGNHCNDYCHFYCDNPNKYTLKGEIFDLRGRKIADMEVVKEGVDALLKWGGNIDVKPGVYIWQIKGGGKVENGTVVVAR
ncbi:MAG: fibronectin type III domain-containing protein [bacterium]